MQSMNGLPVAVSRPNMSTLARSLGDPRRASMMQCMLDGRAWTATELANAAGVGRSTATEHLHQLVSVGLVEERRQGRHRYVRIADDETAELVERLGALAARRGEIIPASRTYRAQRADSSLRQARTCYRHLAGELGVSLAEGMRRVGYVSASWEITNSGREYLAQMDALPRGARSRPLLRPCLDWTERREHLSGPGADALLAQLLGRGFLVPGPVPRSLVLTPEGATALASVLFVDQ